MNNPKPLHSCILWLILCASGLPFFSIAQSSASDSIQSPFRKGRWVTGLSGSIGSTTNDIGGQKNFSNRFTMDFSNGRFSKDRWLSGFKVNASRQSQDDAFNSESLYLGPSLAHYFSKSSQGSVYLLISLGYVRFRQENTISQGSSVVSEIYTGQGVGNITELGYSYVIGDKVTFDLGLQLNYFRIWAERELEPTDMKTNENLNINDLTFSFGFNILLDKFFF